MSVRWYGHVMRREDDFVIKVTLSMNMTGRRPRGRRSLLWINNTSSHLEETNISMKEDGKETEGKAQVTADQQHHQPPGGKEHQPER